MDAKPRTRREGRGKRAKREVPRQLARFGFGPRGGSMRWPSTSTDPSAAPTRSRTRRRARSASRERRSCFRLAAHEPAPHLLALTLPLVELAACLRAGCLERVEIVDGLLPHAAVVRHCGPSPRASLATVLTRRRKKKPRQAVPTATGDPGPSSRRRSRGVVPTERLGLPTADAPRPQGFTRMHQPSPTQRTRARRD